MGKIRSFRPLFAAASAPGGGGEYSHGFFALDRQCPTWPFMLGGMKIKRTYKLPAFALHFPPTTIAQFGAARLVRHFDGPYELVGGTPEERADAAEWCALFAPDVVFSGTRRQNAVSAFAT